MLIVNPIESLTNVNQVPSVHDLVNQGTAGRVGIIAVGPINAQSEGLVLPSEEADALDNGRLDNLLAREDSPGNSVGTVAGSVGPELAILGDGIIRQVGVPVDTLKNLRKDIGVDKQFKVRLLVDVSVGRAPTVDGVRRLDAIDGRLRVHSQETALVEIDKVLSDLVGLGSERSLTPGERVDLVVKVADKEVGDILDRLRLTPLLAVCFVGTNQANAVCVQLAKGRRPGITPPTVGELVPVRGTDDVRLVAVSPEYGTNVLVATAKSLGGLPRKGLLKRSLGTGSPVKLLEDHTGSLGQVHGVKVKVEDSVLQKLSA